MGLLWSAQWWLCHCECWKVKAWSKCESRDKEGARVCQGSVKGNGWKCGSEIQLQGG